ncbi:Glutamyl-tRNA(Gln) amidotransferase subunit A [Estrella lausannensis]|uniref:Glutamyl-tRNA(Gln) amidotransferase subunit A n=1 Tax=Estrella lausannensis TaxID=483423 RepID=A0A0H5E551_9BACT|nr:Glutamyl-tRNA(Gln) amidotransferase subunit A [Estrella lausannensis]
MPAAFTGLIGYKPTYGPVCRVSRFGLVAYGSSLDQIGPLATSVEDAALMMEVIGQSCERDSTSIPRGSESILPLLGKSISGLRVGVPYHAIESLAEEPKKAFEKGLERLQSLGATVVPIELSMIKYSIPVYYILATAEASTNLARFDGIRYGVRSKQAKSLKEVYRLSKEEGFGAEVKRRILLGTFVLSAGYQDAYYKKAQKVRTLMLNEFEGCFKTCDTIAMPVSPFAAFEADSIKDPIQMYLEDIYTILSNLVGCPSISVPNGFTKEGMPLGFQLLARQHEDARLLSVAHAFHSAGEKCQIPESYR